MPMFLRYLFTIVFIFSSTLAYATPQQLLENLHNMRLASTNAVTNFYMFSGLDAASKYEQRIQNSIDRFDKILVDSQLLAKQNDMTTNIASISDNWKNCKAIITTKRTDPNNKGFTDLPQ